MVGLVRVWLRIFHSFSGHDGYRKYGKPAGLEYPTNFRESKVVSFDVLQNVRCECHIERRVWKRKPEQIRLHVHASHHQIRRRIALKPRLELRPEEWFGREVENGQFRKTEFSAEIPHHFVLKAMPLKRAAARASGMFAQASFRCDIGKRALVAANGATKALLPRVEGTERTQAQSIGNKSATKSEDPSEGLYQDALPWQGSKSEAWRHQVRRTTALSASRGDVSAGAELLVEGYDIRSTLSTRDVPTACVRFASRGQVPRDEEWLGAIRSGTTCPRSAHPG